MRLLQGKDFVFETSNRKCYNNKMSNVKIIDVADIRFTSTVFPTDEDKALWASLNDEQRRAVIEQSEQVGFDSGIAERASLHEILSEIRTEI